MTALVFLLAFAGCDTQTTETTTGSTETSTTSYVNIVTMGDGEGQTYLYEKDGAGFGGFTITLHDDGRFSYYEGGFSSYIGNGAWTREGDIITITDKTIGRLTDHGDMVDFERVNRFRLEGDTLVFLKKGSDNFMYLKVKDGERFSLIQD